MEITIRRIVNAVSALGKLMAADLPLRTAYTLKKNVDSLQKEMDFFSQEREKTIKRIGSVDDSGAVSFAPGKQKEAEDAILELLAMTVTPDVTVIHIPLSSGIRLSAGDIEALAPFVEFADNEQEESI